MVDSSVRWSSWRDFPRMLSILKCFPSFPLQEESKRKFLIKSPLSRRLLLLLLQQEEEKEEGIVFLTTTTAKYECGIKLHCLDNFIIIKLCRKCIVYVRCCSEILFVTLARQEAAKVTRKMIKLIFVERLFCYWLTYWVNKNIRNISSPWTLEEFQVRLSISQTFTSSAQEEMKKKLTEFINSLYLHSFTLFKSIANKTYWKRSIDRFPLHFHEVPARPASGGGSAGLLKTEGELPLNNFKIIAIIGA